MKTLFHWMLALGMLITGSINTIVTRGADKTKSKNRHGDKVEFSHPFFQAALMFLGESLCLVAYYISLWRTRRAAVGHPELEAKLPKPQTFSKFIFMLPAACDMTATSTMYIGLTLTYASDFQMLRGCVVIFTGIMSCVFLKRVLRLPHWLGMLLVTLGTAAVGMSSLVCKSDSDDARNVVLGNVLIILAQIVVAIQMVVEEKFIGGYDVPALQVVGLEGVFGFCMLSCVLVVLYHIPQPKEFNPVKVDGHAVKGDHFEDTIDAFVQLKNSPAIMAYSLGTIFSIAFFNYFGISITKHLNAATRMVLDSVRTIVIWAFSMGVGWQKFCYMQVIGFVVLLAGTVVFNELVKVPGYTAPPEEPKHQRLLEVTDDDMDVAREEGYLFSHPSPAFPTADQLYTPTLQRATLTRKN